MSTFALIHGAYHGAWCWQKLIPALEARGHRAVAMDLPSEDPRAGSREYAAAVLTALGDTDDDVVVVGHSLGGLTAPLVATLRPVRRITLLCAMHPVPGRSFDETTDFEPDLYGSHIAHGEKVTGSDGVTRWEEPEDAIPVFYHDCAPADALWAASMLRGQTWKISQELTPLERWPDVETRVIACTEDRALNAAWVVRTARERLGCEPVELPGGHSPMLSQPGRVADVLTT